jgi:S-adenosylmethionine synthetase
VAETGKRGESVGEDVKVLGLRAEDAQERLRWRRLIRGTV